MVALSIPEVERMLQRSERDFRFVLSQAGCMTDTTGRLTEVADGNLLILLLHDLLLALKFEERDVLLILNTFSPHLHSIGEHCGAQSKQSFALQVADNRFVSLSGLERLYDIREMAWKERIRQPLVSLVIVLPELFRRAVSTLEGPRGQLT